MVPRMVDSADRMRISGGLVWILGHGNISGLFRLREGEMRSSFHNRLKAYHACPYVFRNFGDALRNAILMYWRDRYGSFESRMTQSTARINQEGEQKLKRQINFHYDAGHGWLAITLEALSEVGLNPTHFTRYSYFDGQTLYAEEDCDAQLYLAAHVLKFGYEPEIITIHDGDESFIRSKPGNFSGGHWSQHAAILAQLGQAR